MARCTVATTIHEIGPRLHVFGPPSNLAGRMLEQKRQARFERRWNSSEELRRYQGDKLYAIVYLGARWARLGEALDAVGEGFRARRTALAGGLGADEGTQASSAAQVKFRS